MSLDHILLGMLREPAFGYELREEFGRTAMHFWSARLSQIYPTLKRMVEKGWLSVREEPSSKGPKRKVYEITPEGREELIQWLRSGPELNPERRPYVGQLFFMDELDDPEALASFVRELRDEFGGRLQALRAIERGWAGASQEEHPVPLEEIPHGYRGPALTLRLGIMVQEARVDWCDRTLEALAEWLRVPAVARAMGGEPTGE